MSTSKLIELYFVFWFVTIPLTLYYSHKIITELLDLIFNTRRIDNLLRHSDGIDIKKLEDKHQVNRQEQSSLSESNIAELKRQVDYLKLHDKNPFNKRPERGKIAEAKNLSDIFRLKKK